MARRLRLRVPRLPFTLGSHLDLLFVLTRMPAGSSRPMPTQAILTVTAAVIRREGRILICRRRTDQDHAGKWEFPGGKVETGETPQDALRRELQEELEIQSIIDREVKRYSYSYPGRRPLELIFFSVTEFTGNLDYSHFHEVCWALPAELPSFDFLEGDVEFVKELAAQG